MKYHSLFAFLLAGCLAASAAGQRGADANVRSGMMSSLNGNILSNDGNPIDNAQIEVRDMMTGALVVSCYSSSDGTFTLRDLPAGRYELRAVSGLRESREDLQLDGAGQQITMRLAVPASRSSGATISVAGLKVPAKARKEYDKAAEALAKHKLDDARTHCAQALAASPTYSPALTLGAVLDLSEDKFDAAAQKAEQSVQSDSSYGMGYVVLASVYNSMSRYDDALRALDRGVPLTANSWQAEFELGKALLGKADYARSLASLERAEQSAPPNYAPIHLVRTYVYVGMTAYSDAMRELQTYLRDDPDSAQSADVRSLRDRLQAVIAANPH